MRRDPLALLQPSDLRRIADTLELTEISDSSDLQRAASLLLMVPKSSKWLKSRNDFAHALGISLSDAIDKLTKSSFVQKRLLDEVAFRVSADDRDRFDAMLGALEDCRRVVNEISAGYHVSRSRPPEVEETAEKLVPLVAAYRKIVKDQIGAAEWRDTLPGKNSQEEPALRYKQYAFARAVITSVHTASKDFPLLELTAGFETSRALEAKGVSALRNALERAMQMLDQSEPDE